MNVVWWLLLFTVDLGISMSCGVQYCGSDFLGDGWQSLHLPIGACFCAGERKLAVVVDPDTYYPVLVKKPKNIPF